MPRNLKIALSVAFTLLVAFAVARSCISKKAPVKVPERRPGIIQKTIKKISKQPVSTIVPTPSGKTAKMAIILDDWGNNYSLLRDAKAIDRPLTLAILPHLPASWQIAEDAKRHGLGVMLHMPMQAKSASAPREPQTITTDLPDAQVKSYLASALESVPQVEGVNNHQGSAATSDPRIMHLVLSELKKKDLFFIDSHVIATTVGPRIAKETGVRFTKRDVFIDNVMTREAIRAQLERARDIALKKGRVVVIGHDKKLTLQVIKEVVPEFEKQGIRFVLAEDLVQ